MPRGGGRLQALPRPREAYLVCVWPSCQKLACRLSTGHYLLAPPIPAAPAGLFLPLLSLPLLCPLPTQQPLGWKGSQQITRQHGWGLPPLHMGQAQLVLREDSANAGKVPESFHFSTLSGDPGQLASPPHSPPMVTVKAGWPCFGSFPTTCRPSPGTSPLACPLSPCLSHPLASTHHRQTLPHSLPPSCPSPSFHRNTTPQA